MVDTHSRGYLLAARRMFWSGVSLFGLGLAAGWSATGRWATSWDCDPTCRPGTSTTWHVIEFTALAVIVLGTALAVSAFLMIMLRRPRPRPESDSSRATE
ncbi:hypothetical protein OHA98_22345 [Streptomyces sp. NBC_00654]|uniref:hypothetical protein n=1 Tax=Streptomyces sp. NBC_00654 TaxID=2975799 RepID=UPI0022575872|nr:hypothetical protein [Streptomyces sp. NBC_00654]MCX4967449.1 hypothetical protein [Streptomyces sp. NBC_00654]